MFNKLLSTYPGFDLKQMRYDGLLDKLNKSFKKKTLLVNKKSTNIILIKKEGLAFIIIKI